MTVVVIPAYEPDQRLVDLVEALLAAAPDLHVLVVDDGSGPQYRRVFAQTAARGATVLRHAVNYGKGRALKTAFAYVADHLPGQAVVCADADGQHGVLDVLKVAAAVSDATTTMVLGGRRFTGHVPARSRVGNTAVRALVRTVTGLAVHDTQTGLRGYPPQMLAWLTRVPGERFEYEMRLLLEAGPAGYRVREVEIATVYLDHNASSHFRPVVDSARVLAPVLLFSAASLVGFVVDTGVLLALSAVAPLGAAVVGARLVSGTVNLALNRHVTFRAGRRAPLGHVVLRYTLLAAALLAASYLMLTVLTAAGVPLLAAKVGSDLTLLAVSYRVQRGTVFRDRSVTSPAAGGPSAGGQPRGSAGTDARASTPAAGIGHASW